MAPGFRTPSNVLLRYIPYGRPGTTQTLKLPMVYVRLIHAGNIFDTIALIDSGATATFIPLEIADILELDMSGKRTRPMGAAGEFESVVSNVETCELFRKKNQKFDTFANMKVEIPTKPQTLPYMVLGRDSIFRHFNIRFQENDRKVILRRAS